MPAETGRAPPNVASGVVAGRFADLRPAYAAFDGSARFVTGGVRPSRFAAQLAPFRSQAEAEAALLAAGAEVEP